VITIYITFKTFTFFQVIIDPHRPPGEFRGISQPKILNPGGPICSICSMLENQAKIMPESKKTPALMPNTGRLTTENKANT